MHKYNNQDHAMMTGMLTALNIIRGETIFDVWQVNADAEYSETGASGAERALSSERLVRAGPPKSRRSMAASNVSGYASPQWKAGAEEPSANSLLKSDAAHGSTSAP